MAENFVAVPRYDDNLDLQVVFEYGKQLFPLNPVILLKDFVGHNDLISAFDKVAAVQN